ncbi:MAG: adenylosuccinate synthase [Candidatus Acetothermia bacterium]|jgi:adenylosuccinate synthase|nr:adenylosuccinate synthase [Candidatus Acetothermia bacterium]
MPGIAVIGAQWGDEAKGKVVHFLARDADMCVRFNGGPNAGHTVEDDHGTVRLHLVPAGALRPRCRGVLAHGVALDPWALEQELAELAAQRRPEPDLLLSERAHLILPHHRLVEEQEGTAGRLGTTRRGVGPAYQDRAARQGLRLADLADVDLVREHLHDVACRVGGFAPDPIAGDLIRFQNRFADRIGDAQGAIEQALAAGKTVIFEGAQGTLLDLDFGTYPYVTSSCTTVHGVGWGAGIHTDRVERVIGVAKAYTTRVGEGPFPTEDHGPAGERLREGGSEFGVTTGRPRRCGWLDLVALRYAHRVNRFTELALTKLDVLAGIPEVRVCVAYRIDGARTDRFPVTARELARAEPVYEALPGWRGDVRKARSFEDLPAAARRYVAFIADAVGVPVTLIGVGPHEVETLNVGR